MSIVNLESLNLEEDVSILRFVEDNKTYISKELRFQDENFMVMLLERFITNYINSSGARDVMNFIYELKGKIYKDETDEEDEDDEDYNNTFSYEMPLILLKNSFEPTRKKTIEVIRTTKDLECYLKESVIDITDRGLIDILIILSQSKHYKGIIYWYKDKDNIILIREGKSIVCHSRDKNNRYKGFKKSCLKPLLNDNKCLICFEGTEYFERKMTCSECKEEVCFSCYEKCKPQIGVRKCPVCKVKDCLTENPFLGNFPVVLYSKKY